MKSLLIICLCFIYITGFPQVAVKAYPLSVTYQMTTNIIFPYKIKKADIGSGDVIGHRDDLLENVLFIKANRKYFVPTNLSVYTTDGKFYSFFLTYSEMPDTINLTFVKNRISSLSSENLTSDEMLDSDAIIIDRQPAFLHCRIASEKMKADAQGFYLRDQILWLKIRIDNHSEINYQPDFMKFYIQDKYTAKRTAVQETELTPLWKSPPAIVSGKENRVYVFGFQPFTLASKKRLIIEIREKNGDRTLIIEIKSKKLLRARMVNQEN